MPILFEDDSLKVKCHTYFGAKDNMAPHEHDFLTISLVLDGHLHESAFDRQAVALGGHVSVKPPGAIHGDVFVEDATIISIQVYDTKWYGLDLCEWQWSSLNNPLEFFLNIARTQDKRSALQHLQQELRDNKHNEPNSHQHWLTGVYHTVCNNFKEPICISSLAKSVDKHPVYVSRAFRKAYGSDIKTYQAKLRLGYAVAQHLNTNRNLTTIAYDCGFADQSHFNRTFKRFVGIPPKKALKHLQV